MKNNIIQTNTKVKFIQRVCETIKEQANKSIKIKGSFTFVLSGGRTPKDIFDELAQNYQKSIDWSKVHFFWLDERCVEPTHVDSNYKLAYDRLLSKLDAVGSVHRIKGELSPNDAVKKYEHEIQDFFGNEEIIFDFILLGMGEDGHVASLFPNSREIELKDHSVLGTEQRYSGYYRVTLGLDVINKSRFNLLLLNSKNKKDVLKNGYFKPIHMVKIDNIINFEEAYEKNH